MKTAVEWLLDNLITEPHSELDFEHNENCWNKAKEMFEEQVTLSHINGQSEFDKGAISENTKKLATEYYNQTFKSEQNGNSINKYNECLCWVYAWNMVE